MEHEHHSDQRDQSQRKHRGEGELSPASPDVPFGDPQYSVAGGLTPRQRRILALQQTRGNQYVQRVLGREEQDAKKQQESANPASYLPPSTVQRLPESAIPRLDSEWEIAVLSGPQGAPDFFTEADIETLLTTPWKVHYNSSRTGVRLIGPKPTWSRQDGGEAGLHPSNIHDNAYAVGTLDFTGDMPVILGPDGPSLGGFVCPITIATAELWKVGQLKAGDIVRFRSIDLTEARALSAAQESLVAHLSPSVAAPRAGRSHETVLFADHGRGDRPALTVRQDGDACVLLEYGPMVLDLALRFRVQALLDRIAEQRIRGILDLTPGIRSLHVHFDDTALPREALIDLLTRTDADLPPADAIEVPSRIVHLPLSWEDPATLLAIRKYMQSVRADAPWCPSNIEFIRRINGLASVEDVREIVYSASYLVLGLGDVYLGAPVATPVDPRHRLVTTKYNPARTWTPENAVGIGGAYLCVYGMEGPGGYQFVGRTCQMWNRIRPADPARPWLLRFFDQIRFYPVTEQELLAFREDFPRGRAQLSIEPTTFRLAEYQAFLRTNETSIAAFKARQQAAFEEERERWALLPPVEEKEPDLGATTDELRLAPGQRAVRSQIAGSVWQLVVQPGQRVNAGDKLVILETMKMETVVTALDNGVVASIQCRQGMLVAPGTPLVVLDATGGSSES